MAKQRPGKDKAGEKKPAADYYKLKTQAVEDLVTADAENSPEVSQEELTKYGARKKGGIPNWLKVCFIKFWFAGAVFFFIIMGLGLWDPLDQIVITGIILGMVTDLLTNNMLRFVAPEDGANDPWLMFSKKRYVTFFLNILYAMLLCAMVFLGCYPGLERVVNLAAGTQGVQYLVGEPVGFGAFYMLCDILLVGLKKLAAKGIGRAKNKNV